MNLDKLNREVMRSGSLLGKPVIITNVSAKWDDGDPAIGRVTIEVIKPAALKLARGGQR